MPLEAPVATSPLPAPAPTSPARSPRAVRGRAAPYVMALREMADAWPDYDRVVELHEELDAGPGEIASEEA